MRASHIERAVKGVFVLPFTGFCLYYCIEYSVEWVAEPISTTVSDIRPDFHKMSGVTICADSWVDQDAIKNETELRLVVGYVLGNMINADLPEIRDKGLMNRTGTFVEQMVKDTSLWPVAAELYEKHFPGLRLSEAIKNLSGIRVLNKEKHAASSQEANVTLNYIWPEKACAVVLPFSRQNNYTLIRDERREGTTMNAPNYRIALPLTSLLHSPSKPTSVLRVSLFDGDSFPIWNLKQDFTMHEYSAEDVQLSEKLPAEVVAIKTLTINAMLGQATHLKGRVHNCKENTEKGRQPIGLLSRLCRIECQEKAIRKHFNCTTINITEVVKVEETAGFPTCNLLTETFNGSFNSSDPRAEQALRESEECEEKIGCNGMKYCDEFQARGFITENSQTIDPKSNWGDVDFDKYIGFSINVVWPDTLRTIEEYTAYTLEGFFGTVGGIIGIFLGLSLVSCVDLLAVTAGQKCGTKEK